MALPRPRVDNRYRTQEVNLQPYGNTVSVEADSDNPFEDDRDVEIVTQASGGMAGPDPRQRSRGLLVSRPRDTRRQGGQARAFRTTMDAAHPGFMPGMGGAPQRRPQVKRMVRVTHPGFVPGMGGVDRPVRRRPPMGRHNGYMPGMGADPVPAAPAAGTPAWLQAVQAAGQTAASVTQARYDAQTAAATAKSQQALMAAEQARADQMRSQSMMSSTLANMNKNKVLTYGLIGVGVLALGAAFFFKKGKRK